MACRTPADPQLIYGEIDASLSSAAIDRLKRDNLNCNEENSEPDTSTSGEESHIGSEGEETSTEQRTFLVIVNDDGSFTLDSSGVIVKNADPDTVIPVTLPLNKMKSVEQPLPGARTLPSTGRSRKAKLQTRTGLNSESDPSYEFVATSSDNSEIPVIDLEDSVSPLDIHLPNARGVLVSGTISLESVTVSPSVSPIPTPASVIVSNPANSTPSIDLTDFTKQLDPQSLANLENVLQSEQAREILETLTFDEEVSGVANALKSESAQPLWDHSYSQSVSSTRTVITGPSPAVGSTSVIVPVQSVIQAVSSSNSPPSVVAVRRDSVSKPSAIVNSPSPAMPPVITVNNNPKGRPSSGSSSSGGSRRVSEADRESNANIRRSQRQQDRIERQEAERIMAENQQMLQREKEIMKEAKSVSVVSSPINPAGQTVQHSVVTEVSVVATPVPVPVAPLPVTPVVAAVVEDTTTPKSESGRPKRQNRKLPAHLADPNYVHFDEDVKIVKEIKTIENEPEVEVKEEPDDELTILEGDDEEVTEDDPNRLWCICRQPHNNRFMICCDKCEEWFHGKCVGVTKAQGKAMELKQVLWHCPNCKKELKPPAKINQKPSVIVKRNSDSTPTATEKPAGVRKVGRPPKNKAIVSTPVSSKVQETVTEITPKQIKKKFDTPPAKTESVSEKANNCMVCGKSARKDSAYCSDKCVQKWAESVGSKVSVVPVATKPAVSIPNANVSTPAPTASAPSTANTTPAASSPPYQKLKRANSLKQLEPEKATPFLTFHVISSGSTKSTETVPPRPKELTASALLKQSQLQQQQQSTTTPQKTPTTPISPTLPNILPTVPGIGPNNVNTIASSKPAVVANKVVEGENKLKTSFKVTPLKIDTAVAQSQPPQIQSPTTPVGSKRSRTSSESSSSKAQKITIKKDKEPHRPKEKEKEIERDGPTSEKLLRENMRKTIREVLKNRLKDVDDDEKKILESSGNTADIMAEKIEEELCRCYGGASNPKCKAKYRSIYFNFKDNKNSLFREILAGNIKPKVLVRMEPQQMASAELTEWRLKENRKELDAIKRAELDKLAEAKKQQLIDSGVDDAVVVAEETRPKDITDVIDADKEKSSTEKDKKEKKDGSHSHSSHRRDKDKRSKDKDRDDKRRDSKDHGSSSKDKDRRDREKDKDSRRRSSRHRHRSGEKSKERDREKERRHKEKDGKEATRSSKSDTNNEISRRDSESSKHTDKKEITKIAEEETKMDDTSKTSYSGDDSTPTQPQTTPTENSKSDPRHSTDSEQEQPSSTIKTPDFVEDGSSHAAQFVLLNGGGCKPIFNSSLTMQELGNLAVSVYDVSHVGLEGTLFPEAPVPFVGRISPDTVWDYINKMKKTKVIPKNKEVIIFRLAPATQADTAIYTSFYDYLHGRGRLGVLGSINHPLKDVYLCPLDKHTPMNRSLLPFRGGPGIPKERTNCLLAIVTRHIVDVNHQALKRKGSISGDVSKKKLKVESGKSGTQKSASGNKVATRKISMDVKVENPLPDADVELKESTQVKVENSEVTKDDDDEPYTPWEDDDVEAVDVKPAPPVCKPDTHKLLEELNAKIERERQEIENIAGAISNRKNLTGIPGLDGDFPDSSSPKIVTKPIPEQVPFFLRNKDVGSNSAQSRDIQPVNIPGLDMEVESSFTTPKKPQEVVDIRDDDDDYDDEEPVEIFTPSQTYAADPRRRDPVVKLVTSTPIPIVPQPSEIIPGLSNDATDNADSEAYSPSAVHFSDEEDKKDLEDENDSRETIVDDTDEEPLPPGVEKESSEAPLTSPIKPVFKLEDPRLSVTMTCQAEEIEKPSTASLMELEDDSEPPPPGETTAPSTPIKINLPNVFESPSTDDLPFPSMVVLSKASQKVKININLSTKILPTPKENEDQNANKSETPGLKIQRQLPALKPMQKSSTTATPPSPQHVQPPSPAMPKLHQPPPCIPALQKAPMVPGLALPIQMPPPPLQNIPPMPLQIPPPNLQPGPPPPRISLGININVPPPPLTGLGIIPQIPGMMPRGMPPLTPGGIRFPPPTSIPPPPIISKNEGSLNPAATVVGGVRRPFIPPIPNPLAKPGLRQNTPRMAAVPDVSVIDNSNKIPRTSTPEKSLEHNIRGRDRESRFDRNNRGGDIMESRFDRNIREGDIRESRFDRNRNEGELDVDRRRPYQPGDRGRNFHRKPFDNRMRRRSRSDERSTRSRSSERRRRRGGRSSRSRSPPSWRRNRRSRSRSPRSSNRRFRTRSRSHSPSHDNKSPGIRRSANHLRSSRSKDKSRSRSRSPKRSYSRRSRSKSNSKSRSPSVSSKTVKPFSTEKVKSPPHDGKSPIIGSREEDWEDDPDDVSGSQMESRPESHSEKESSFEFSADKIGAVAIHLSPEIVQMD